ncbi:stage II sporulation protein M [Bacillus toyonensis]|uniref:stage II sporulation protein M n=1 Tax=Bacillus toyonensis TaxID=155322 RepID=UPI000BFE0F2E|nr:stage II sporulation protein M [Bacillus toyonensis]PHA07908.1 hypothetical protein COE66_24020 [Bacillus toyonensis]
MSLNRSQKIVIFTIIFSLLSIGFLTGYKLITLFDLNATDYNGADYYKNNEGFSGVISIFMNNIKIDILVISGIFLLCLPTILLLFMNGFWIGATIKASLSSGLSIKYIILSILPHGILEIPILILAAYIGMQGIYFYQSKNKDYKKIVRIIILTIVLGFIASMIEVYITPIFL